MTRVALVVPGKNEAFAVQEPLNVGFIASYLESKGVDVRIIDELAGQDVEKEIKKFSPDIVGITATTPLVEDAYRIAAFCKKEGILTVMGGRHASILPDEVLKHVDIAVVGEGEYAMMDIINKRITSGIVKCDYIKNLDDTPPPARHLMQTDFYLRTKDRIQESYLDFVPLHTKTAGIITSRGCPYSCIFCHNSWKDVPYRCNSAERVISEIESLIKEYDLSALFFLDDNLFVNKPRLHRICQLMKERNINLIWGGNARADNVDLETLKLVKSVGCKQVTFGFESGSQRMLDVLNKRETVEQMSKAIKLCKEAGLAVNGTFMIGNPTETIGDIRMTQEFIKNHDLNSYGVCITTPLPGTKLWQWCEEKKIIPEKFKWSDFNYTGGRIPILACDTIPYEELIKLYYETAHLRLPKSPLLFPRIAKEVLKHPVATAQKAIRNPRRILNILRRLKL